MHRTGHWLGMDVHDCGSYVEPTEVGQTHERKDPLSGETITDRPSRILRPGMALTIEPGLYVRPSDRIPKEFWNIGIRIEDDAFVTETRLRTDHAGRAGEGGRDRGADAGVRETHLFVANTDRLTLGTPRKA
jgi:Xaa-Pro aminopeptidase